MRIACAPLPSAALLASSQRAHCCCCCRCATATQRTLFDELVAGALVHHTQPEEHAAAHRRQRHHSSDRRAAAEPTGGSLHEWVAGLTAGRVDARRRPSAAAAVCSGAVVVGWSRVAGWTGDAREGILSCALLLRAESPLQCAAVAPMARRAQRTQRKTFVCSQPARSPQPFDRLLCSPCTTALQQQIDTRICSLLPPPILLARRRIHTRPLHWTHSINQTQRQ